LDSAEEDVNADGAAAGGPANGDGVCVKGEGSAAGGAANGDGVWVNSCGVGGISGSSEGAGACADRSTENTD
jgi:hypothetical protein